MSTLRDDAVTATRKLPASEQEQIARAVLRLADWHAEAPVMLSAEEREAIGRSRAAAARGEFASDAEVQSVWDRYDP